MPPAKADRIVRLELPLPCSINGLYFTPRCPQCGYGAQPGQNQLRLRKSFEARHYTQHAQAPIVGAGLAAGWRWKRGQPIGIRVTVFFKNKRRDSPNIIKHLVDTLAEALGFDDRYIARLEVLTKYDRENPRVEVEVEVLSEWP